MAQFIDEQLNKDDERIRYEMYLEEARAKVDPDMIPDDEGVAYWDFRCLFSDCMAHEFSRYYRFNGESTENSIAKDQEEELRLAAECEVICTILSHKPKFCFA